MLKERHWCMGQSAAERAAPTRIGGASSVLPCASGAPYVCGAGQVARSEQELAHAVKGGAPRAKRDHYSRARRTLTVCDNQRCGDSCDFARL